MSKKINLIGRRFGRLKVFVEGTPTPSGKATWICECDCGNTTAPIQGGNLRSGQTKSCGCLHYEYMRKTNPVKVKHGQSYSRLYRIHRGMKNRCLNPNAIGYKNYGGRGITVCDEWRNSFQAFYDWAMANGYADNLTIDRKDSSGNYEPSNCRWATMKEQQNNRRNNRIRTSNV